MIRVFIIAGAVLLLAGCLNPRTARGAPKADRVCAALNKQDPGMLQLAVANWHMVPDEVRRQFKSSAHFARKVRSCRRA